MNKKNFFLHSKHFSFLLCVESLLMYLCILTYLLKWYAFHIFSVAASYIRKFLLNALFGIAQIFIHVLENVHFLWWRGHLDDVRRKCRKRWIRKRMCVYEHTVRNYAGKALFINFCIFPHSAQNIKEYFNNWDLWGMNGEKKDALWCQ